MKYYNTELDVNKRDEGVLKDLYEVTKSIDQSLKNLAMAGKWVVWYLILGSNMTTAERFNITYLMKVARKASAIC